MLFLFLAVFAIALFRAVSSCSHDSERGVGRFTETEDGIEVTTRYFECEQCGNVRKEETKSQPNP